jgi:hypothetical protein
VSLEREKTKIETVHWCTGALLPPIFPLNRAFNAIWWQGGSPVFYFFSLQNLEGEEKKVNFAT